MQQADTPNAPAATAPIHGHGLLEEASVTQGKLAFSQWLDLFRWIAALLVVFNHCSNRFIVPITSVDAAHRVPAYYLLSFLGGFGRQAVMIFFVLSGYLVGGGLWKDSRKSTALDIPKYLIKRLSRLGIVVFPTLLAVFLLDSLGIFVFHGIGSGVYPQDILRTLQPGTLVCNAAFLQTAACKPFGDDNALWSLFNEFWYYVLWPLFLLAVTAASKWRRGAFLAAAVGLLTILSVMQNKEYALIAPYMVIWITGVFVAIIPRPIMRSLPLSAGLFLAALAADRLLVRRAFVDAHVGYVFLIDFIIGILFANMLVTMRARNTLRPPPGKQANTTLASFSFSLYCIHTPVLMVFGAALMYYTGTGWGMAPDHAWQWGAIAGAVALSVTAAYLLSRVTEAHTDKLRRFLLGVLSAYRLRVSSTADARKDAVA